MIADRHSAPARTRHGWIAALLAIGSAAAVVFGCKQAPEASAEPSQSTSAALQPAAEAVPTKAQARYEEESFELVMRPSGPYQAGQQGAVEIVLQAKGEYKCNDKYPYKFKVKESDGVRFASMVLKKDAVELEKKEAIMKVQFTPVSKGEKTVAGQFAFSVCTEERCLVERRDLALKVDVQ